MDLQAVEKHALVQTCNTPGWSLITRTAEALVREFEKRAIGCDDEQKIVPLQRKAQAAREFWDTLVNHLDRQKFVDAGPDPEFVSVDSE